MWALRAALLATSIALSCARPTGAGSRNASDRQEIETWQIHLNLAENAERQRNHDVARIEYAAAAEAATEPRAAAEVAKRFADTLVSWGQLEQARVQLERCVVHAPQRADAWHDLGLLRFRTNDRAGAAQALLRSISLMPTDPRSRIALSALYWNTGQLPLALAQYQQLQQLGLSEALQQKVTWAISRLQELTRNRQ